VAGLLAAWTATRAVPGPGGTAAGVMTLVVVTGAMLTGVPVLPLWFAWAAAKGVRRSRWTLTALLAACALLPAANPTGSPTYAIFAVFTAAFVTAGDDLGMDGMLYFVRGPRVAAAVAAVLLLALAVRTGWPLPALSRVAAPLLAGGGRAAVRGCAGRGDEVRRRTASRGGSMPGAGPSDADALDRRFRPPTDDHHLATWLDWRRGGPPTSADTLVFGFGGDTLPGMDTLFTARGRYAGDALVLRRSSVAPAADTLTTSRL
jgi:hypothetical protein